MSNSEKSRFGLQTGSPYAQKPPVSRGLRIFSIDPSLERRVETAHIKATTVEIPLEVSPTDPTKDGLDLGPVIGGYLKLVGQGR